MRRGCRAHARVLVTTTPISSAVHLAQGLVRRVPRVRAAAATVLAVAVAVAVAIIVVVSRGDPPGAPAPALEHAADFLAEGAREANGERVRAHAVAPDGVFAACGAVFRRWFAVAQEEVDAGERGDDDDCERYYEHEEGSKGGREGRVGNDCG